MRWGLLLVVASLGCTSITGGARITLSDPPVIELEPGFRNWALCRDPSGRVSVKVYRVSRTATGTIVFLGALAGAPAGPGGAAAGAAVGGLVELGQVLFGGAGADPVPSCSDTFGGTPLEMPRVEDARPDTIKGGGWRPVWAPIADQCRSAAPPAWCRP